MLGSITALGERGRGSTWTSTFVAYAMGSVAGGFLLGAALGVAGSIVRPPSAARLWLLAALIGAGVLLDLRTGGLGLPTVRRQVNEVWLRRYRPWVYAVGFGFQLGLGVVTVVVASAVYATFGAAFLSASAAGGAAIGATFGLLRAATLLPGALIARPAQLVGIDARLRAWEGRARWVALSVQFALLATLLVMTIWTV